MVESTNIFRRIIAATPVTVVTEQASETLSLLAAVEADVTGSISRLYFRERSVGAGPLPVDENQVLWMRVVSGACTLNISYAGSDQVKLPFLGYDQTVPVLSGDRNIFAGRNVLLGTSNGESVAVWLDWLRWHSQNHGANAALIIDRGSPSEVDAKAAEFASVLQSENPDGADLANIPIAVVSFDDALGQPELGHEAHPLYAPDAPGKDRMQKPPSDPWHAPLAYRLLYDLVGRLYLQTAATVLNVNVHELTSAREDGRSVFSIAQDAHNGIVVLQGQRAYPWGLRKSSVASFGDHICTRFDHTSGEARWCVVPSKLPAEAIWMPTRILGVKTHPADTTVWRFMGLRHCQSDAVGVGQIVPKSSLIEEPALLDISGFFDGKPKRQPAFAQGMRKSGDTQSQNTSNGVTIVTTMKNEGPFILEWIAYHRAIGVADFLVYTNDCTDGTDELLQLLASKGFCHWRENPFKGTKMKPQHAALHAAGDETLVRQTDWLICMDVDEFIAVHTGDGSLEALFDAVPSANLISLTWRLFGNNDVSQFEDGFVTQKFTQAAREFANKPHVAWGFKTLFRNNGTFRKMGVHRPKGIQPNAVDHIDWVNGSGDPMPKSQWRNAWRSNKNTYGYDLVSLNHYAVRSAESFLVKRERGRVNHVDRDQGLAYWFRMNQNVVADHRMQKMLPALQREFDRLLSDPEIKAAHDACVAAHQSKIAQLMKQPKYRDFYNTLVSDPMRKLSRLHGHFGTNVYLSGPSVIPDEIVERDPEDEFFFTVRHVGEAEH